MKKGAVAAGLTFLFYLVLAATHVVAQTQAQDDSYFITRDELKLMLGGPDTTLIDMRFGRDWTDATLKIKGAIREDPMKPGMWIDKYPKEKMMVFY
jgi:hypothetical protein